MSQDDRKEFEKQRLHNVKALRGRDDLTELSLRWMQEVSELRYSYNFSWMGLPIIQFPQDVVAMQELIWDIKPDLIIETGIARGGSLVFYASMLELLGGSGKVLGVDIDIRDHNRRAIEGHPMSARIEMLLGSAIDPEVIERVRTHAARSSKVLVVLDSMHTHEHVLAELRAYAPLVSVDSYIVVFDTVIEDMPEDFFPDRPWAVGDNPRTAVKEFLDEDSRFLADKDIDAKLMISVARGGFLKRIRA